MNQTQPIPLDKLPLVNQVKDLIWRDYYESLTVMDNGMVFAVLKEAKWNVDAAVKRIAQDRKLLDGYPYGLWA